MNLVRENHKPFQGTPPLYLFFTESIPREYAIGIGALEPVTALFFGVLIFGEQLTPRIILGILMVITAVTLIIGGKTLLKKSKIRLRHTGR